MAAPTRWTWAAAVWAGREGIAGSGDGRRAYHSDREVGRRVIAVDGENMTVATIAAAAVGVVVVDAVDAAAVPGHRRVGGWRHPGEGTAWADVESNALGVAAWQREGGGQEEDNSGPL